MNVNRDALVNRNTVVSYRADGRCTPGSELVAFVRAS